MVVRVAVSLQEWQLLDGDETGERLLEAKTQQAMQ